MKKNTLKINLTKNKDGQLSKDLNRITGFKLTSVIKKEVAKLDKKIRTSH